MRAHSGEEQAEDRHYQFRGLQHVALMVSALIPAADG
jgi:hypothetical protein